MTIEEIKQDHFYHYSFDFQDAEFQMWVHKMENRVLFYAIKTQSVFIFDDKEINTLNNIVHTVRNYFFQRQLSKEKNHKKENE